MKKKLYFIGITEYSFFAPYKFTSMLVATCPISKYEVFSHNLVYTCFMKDSLYAYHSAEEHNLESDCLGPILILTLNRIFILS